MPSYKNDSFTNDDEKKLIFLKRQWTVFDGHKKYRMQISYMSAFLLLGITAFIVESKSIPNSSFQIYIALAVIVIIYAMSIILLMEIHRYYNELIISIANMYDQLDMKYGVNWMEKPNQDKKLFNLSLFRILYIVITVITILCVVIIYSLPLVK